MILENYDIHIGLIMYDYEGDDVYDDEEEEDDFFR